MKKEETLDMTTEEINDLVDVLRQQYDPDIDWKSMKKKGFDLDAYINEKVAEMDKKLADKKASEKTNGVT